jgi:hypothetical protein
MDFHAVLLRIYVRVVSLVTCFGELFAEFKNLAFITPNQNNLPLCAACRSD